MSMYSNYIEIGIVVILTLIVLSIITYIRKRKREDYLYGDNAHSFDEDLFLDENEHIKITGFKSRKRKRSRSYDLVIKYFQYYQMLIEEIRAIKSSDLINLDKIARIKHHIHLYNSKLKGFETKLDSELKDNELIGFKNELRGLTSPFYKRVLRRLLEFETLQQNLAKLAKKPKDNHDEIEKIRNEQRKKYKEYSQQKLDYFEDRKEVYKKLVYRISSNYSID